ncbi:MAG: cache domain-containing protein [Ignavibacteriaceae bacterium]|nr:cache domain-containing protein [Ignavibacteriaceae bacterium]
MRIKVKMSFCKRLFILFILSLAIGCKEEPNSPGNPPNETETYKAIVKTAVHTTASGFASVMTSIFTDDQSRTEFLRLYIYNNRYFPDSTGYFYINDFSGINIAHGTNLALQGQNRWNVTDSKGTYYIQSLLYNAQHYNFDFVNYYFLNPSTNTNEKKYAYAEAINRTQYALTSGFYLEKDTKFLTNLEKNKLIVSGVTHTFAFGSAAVCKNVLLTPTLQEEYFKAFVETARFLADSSGYISVTDLSGYCVAHGANKSLEGTNVIDLHDFEGTYFISEMIKIAQNPGYGYVQYYFTNPATNKNEQKLVYVERISGTDYFVGTGVY